MFPRLAVILILASSYPALVDAADGEKRVRNDLYGDPLPPVGAARPLIPTPAASAWRPVERRPRQAAKVHGLRSAYRQSPERTKLAQNNGGLRA